MKRHFALMLALLILLGGCTVRPETSASALVSAPEPEESQAAVKPLESQAAAMPGSSDTLEDVQGHWVDINGDNTLDIEGSKLTLSYGEWSETYSFKVEHRGSYEYLVAEDAYGFGIMSELQVREDGTLEAYEMVLDGPSYTYKFMREEDTAAALEIQDLSDPNAPKEIRSGEIDYFSLTFDLSRLRYDLGDEWASGYYSWQIEKQEDNSCEMYFSISGDSYIIAQFCETVDQDYVDGLAELIQEQGLPELNGYYQTNAVDKSGYYLYVEYSSGETLTISADGDPGDTCVFALAPLLDYAAKQDIEHYN